MMVTETSKTINFWGRFVHNMAIYWIAILFITITFFYWQVFLRRIKATNEKITLLTRFTYNMTLLWINKLGNGHNFSLMTSAFLVEDFTNERVYLDIHQSRTCLLGYALLLFI